MSVAQETPVRTQPVTPPSAAPQRPLGRLLPSPDGAHAGTEARARSRVLGFHLSPAAGAGFGNRFPQQARRRRLRRDCARRRPRANSAQEISASESVQNRRSSTPRLLTRHFGWAKFDVAIEPDSNGTFTYRYDPARPESVLARAEVNDALQSAAGRKDPVPTKPVSSSEPGSRYIDFLIPGLLGMNLMNSGMWGIGFALVDMRQRKLLKRFVGTPMRRGDFLLALASSRLILMIIEVGLLLAFGALFFHMRVMGSIAGIALIAGIGSLTFGGVGLLTASRAQKIESVSGLINLVMMPMWIFSGVFFSYERFPAIIHPLIKALPLTALNDALRASILEGTPILHQWPRLLVMVVWGGISFLLALKWFRWT